MMNPHNQMVSAAQVEPRVPQAGLPTTATMVSPSSTTIIAKSSLQKEAVTTTTPSSVHTGMGTVLWGADAAKATPSQLAGAAAISRMASKEPGAGEPTQRKLPPNVNIKNLDSLKPTMPPPVTFAAVASSVDTGAAQVVTQVLSEITATSGNSIPPPDTAVTDNSLRSSKCVNDLTMVSVSEQKSTLGIVSSVSESKTNTVAEAPRSEGTLHTPVAASTPVEPEAVTKPVKFDFTIKNNNASTGLPAGFFMTPVSTGVANTSQSTSACAGPIKFSFGKTTKPQIGGSTTSFSFGPSSTTTLRSTSLFAFNQPVFSQATFAKTEVTASTLSTPAVTKPTASSSSSVSRTTTESKITGDTEAAGNFKFAVNKSGINSSSAPAGGIDEADTKTAQVGVPSFTASGQSTSLSLAVTTTTQSTTSTPVTTGSSFAMSFGSSTVKPQGGTSFSFAPAASRTTSSGVSGSASILSKGYSFTPTAATSVTTVTNTAATSATTVSSTAVSTAGSIFSSGGTASVVSSSSTSSVPSLTITGFSFAPSSTSGASGFGTSSSLFGGSAASKPSLFGQTAGTSGFGTSTASTTTSGFSFGQPTFSSQSLFSQPTTTTQSIFGQPATTSQSVFGQPTTSSQSLFGQPTTTSQSVFGQPTTSSQSAFGQHTTSSQFAFGQPTTNSQSLFGQPTTTTQSIFGQPTTSSQSLFDQPTTSSQSVFGQPPTFGNPTTSLFGQQSGFGTSTASTTTSGFFFGQPTSSSQSLFGQPTTTTHSIFGQPTTSSQSLFGQPTTTTHSIFGQPTTSSQSLFGQPTTTTQSIFGQPITTSQSLFGQPTTTTQSIFGQPITTSQSLFGQPTTTTQSIFGRPITTSQSLFGQPTTTTHSIFGQPTTSSQSLFGQPTTRSQSVFGQPTTSSQSVFGQPTTNSQSLFGQPITTSQSLFGQPTTSSQSLFGQPTTSSQSLFGQPTTSSQSVFGQPTTSSQSVFGQPTTTSQSLFGQPTTSNQSVFGQPTTTSQSLFGQPTTSSQSLFGQPTTSSQSVFGQPSTFGNPTTSLFGQQSGSGQTPASSAASSSLFGQATPTSGSNQSSSGLFGQSSSASPAADPASYGFGGFGEQTQLIPEGEQRMASEQLVCHIDEQFCQCAICLKPFSNPKGLPCLHRFCKECLSPLFLNLSAGDFFYCPLCRAVLTVTEGGVEDLKNDFVVSELTKVIQSQKSLQSQNKSRLCKSCNKWEESAGFCSKCGGFLCQNCFTLHQTLKTAMLKDHQPIIDLKDVISGKVKIGMEKLSQFTKAPRCQNHPENILRLSCVTCDGQQICFACTYEDHIEHKAESIKLLADRERDDLKKKVDELKPILKNWKSNFAKLTMIREQLPSAVTEVKAIVNASTEEKLKKLNERKENVLLLTEKVVSELKQRGTLRKTCLENERDEKIKEIERQYDELLKKNKATTNKSVERKIKEGTWRQHEIEGEIKQLNTHRDEKLEFVSRQAYHQNLRLEELKPQLMNSEKHFQNLISTASIALAVENDWSAVNTIPDLCAALVRMQNDIEVAGQEISSLENETEPISLIL